MEYKGNLDIDDFSVKMNVLFNASDFVWLAERRVDKGHPKAREFHIFEDPFVIECGDQKTLEHIRKMMGHYRLREGYKWPPLELRG
jgi:hypothetical protein